MSQNENSKKNTIGNAAQNNSNSKSIGSNTGNSSDESKSSGSGQTTTKDSSTVATTTPANTIKLSFVGDCLCATDENASYENCFNDVAKAKNPSYFLEKVNSYFLMMTLQIADCENVYSDQQEVERLATRDNMQILMSVLFGLSHLQKMPKSYQPVELIWFLFQIIILMITAWRDMKTQEKL